MNFICGHWIFDGPVDTQALAAMRIARVNHPSPDLQAWRSDNVAVAFGTAWWSPQTDLTAPTLIARHPQTGCVAVADARLDEPDELRAALGLSREQAPEAVHLILHAWLRWGEACPEHIDGDFAFAIHDPRENCLFLARDRMGVRPLYVHHAPGKRIVFGTTSHAVLAHPQVPRDINEARIADYLLELAGTGLEAVDFTSTFHSAVERHPPRHASLVTPRSSQSRQYWRLEPHRTGPLPRTDAEWTEALAAALERAVAQRLRAPGRVGSMLSGGMDSTSLAVIAADQLQAAGMPPLPTFSAIDSSRADCLETLAVRAAIERPGLETHLVDIANPGELRSALEDFLDEFDEPFDMGMTLLDSQYLLAARAGVDALIDGLDGDTLFSAGGVLQRQLSGGHWRALRDNIQGLSRIWKGSPWLYLRKLALPGLVPLWLKRLRRRLKEPVLDVPIDKGFHDRIDVPERLRVADSFYHPGPLRTRAQLSSRSLMLPCHPAGLERYTRTAARHGVTPLHPFFAREVLELGMHVPDRLRMRHGFNKAILREVMRMRMPDSVRLRTDKQHLSWRLTTLLWENRQPDLDHRLQRPPLQGVVDPRQLAWLQQSDKDIAGRHHAAKRIFVGQLAHWLDRNTGSQHPGTSPNPCRHAEPAT